VAVHTKDASQIDFLIGHNPSGRKSHAMPPGEILSPHASKSFRERVGRVKRDTRYAKALQAVMKRVRMNALLGESTLSVSEYRAALASASDLLTELACATVIPNRSKRKKLEETWANGTRKTWKAVKDFPKQIERMADQIERINTSTFLAPVQQINPKARSAEIARHSFRELPGIMRLYARALAERTRTIPRLNASVFPRIPTHYYLMVAVRSWTGKPHDKQVAELLNAAGIALGGKSDFDALALAQARLGHKKKKST
jgi:hypothetical protein